MLMLSLLGPVALQLNGVACGLPIKKTQALLVWLALEKGALRPRLCELLWPALDESTGRRNLRRELARLREAGLAGLVVAQGDRLALDPAVVLDLSAVESARARGQFEVALALFAGPLAQGLELDDSPAFNEHLDAARQRWHGQWRQTLQACITAARTAGDGTRAIQHLQALLDDEPLQEQHYLDLMTLLAQAGRREDALAQFERCRSLLAHELGLQPLPATMALADALRQGRWRFDAPPPAAPLGPVGAPGVAPGMASGVAYPVAQTDTQGQPDPDATRTRLALPHELPFVGRELEIGRLERAWTAGGALLLQGQAGVGKTRLALDFAQAHGPVAVVRCRTGDRGVPYAVFKRGLRALAGEDLGQVAWPVWMRGELARLLPALGPVPRPLASAEDRARFFEACAEAWQMLSAGNFDSVLIDDWHLADAASQALLAHTAQRRIDAGTVGDSAREVITWRERELDAAARATLQGVAGLAPTCQVDLTPWSPDELLDLVRQLSGVPEPRRFSARLMQATQGHPFFVAETLRHLVDSGRVHGDEQGRWQTDFDEATQDYVELDVPASVHAGVRARVQALGEPVQRLLEAASQAGEPFDPGLLAAACALSEMQTATAMEQALDAQLVRELRPGLWGFAHDLVLQAISEGLGADRRRLVHRRLALGAEQAAAEPAVVARHFESGGEPQRAVAWRLRAAERALQVGALSDAFEHWQQALDDQPEPAQEVLVFEGLLRAALQGGREAARVAAIERLAQLIAGGGLDCDAAALAQMLIAEDLVRQAQGDAGQVRIDALLSTLRAGHPLRARALLARTNSLSDRGQLADAEASAQDCLAEAPDNPTRSDLMDTLVLIAFRRGNPQQALSWARKTLDLATALSDQRSAARSLGRVGTLLYMLGQAEEGERELQRGLAMSRELRLVENQRAIATSLAKVLNDRGATDVALQVVQEAWDLSPGFTQPEIKLRLMDTFYEVHYRGGALGAALDMAERVVRDAADFGALRPLMMALTLVLELYVLLDDTDSAARLLALVDGRPATELGYIGVKLNLTRALVGLRSGDLAAARVALHAVGDPQHLQHLEDQATLALRWAQIAMIEGRSDEVVLALRPWCAKWPSPQIAAAGLALLLTADNPASHLAASRAALAQRGTSALPALELRAALVAHDPGLRTALQAEVQRLHASLASHPLAAARFARRWLGAATTPAAG